MDNKITINDKEYPYKLKVSKKAKYMRLQASAENGLEFIIPVGVSQHEAEYFLRRKKAWIEKYGHKLVPGQDLFFFLGEEVQITHIHDQKVTRHKVQVEDNKIVITSPVDSKAQTKTIFLAWLRIKADGYIPSRASALAEKYGYRFNRINIRSQKTRWGSCSQKRTLSFNFKLMHFNKRVIDYVIVHELCHLKEMNHSSRFWKLVEQMMPDYDILRKELKTQHVN